MERALLQKMYKTLSNDYTSSLHEIAIASQSSSLRMYIKSRGRKFGAAKSRSSQTREFKAAVPQNPLHWKQ
ncbi:uncharacterized protein PHALS_14901 [Plasmopara halstedii]|uniref:Uncharacterized protein n=1 Tax=Plasmopara halstedii TaxID=4781 RepID=A0A0P1AZH4_PLAHL|nr:uncharacterized protein PHALS_14901 [Plasmopara halstedii]CEG46567.1 hypothetical protein PHALS_14901 [Plasmopara halstedii]|eukprot:XP_024582936.1 hypothetical protein PHALS_14901 [Plasmopara halstedii]